MKKNIPFYSLIFYCIAVFLAFAKDIVFTQKTDFEIKGFQFKEVTITDTIDSDSKHQHSISGTITNNANNSCENPRLKLFFMDKNNKEIEGKGGVFSIRKNILKGEPTSFESVYTISSKPEQWDNVGSLGISQILCGDLKKYQACTDTCCEKNGKADYVECAEVLNNTNNPDLKNKILECIQQCAPNQLYLNK